MSTRKRINELRQTILNSQNELTDLQEKCSHPSYIVDMYMWRIAAYYPTRICTECDKPIEGITAEEEKRVQREWDTTGTVTGSKWTVTDDAATNITKTK